MASWNGAVASREELRDLKRRAVLRAAAPIFNEKGFHATSLDEVADRIGVTKTALYYYFRNKEQLLYECVKLTYDCGHEARTEAESLAASAIDKLRHLYGAFMRKLMTEPGAYTTMANIRALPADQQAELTERRRGLDLYARSLMEQAVRDGSIRQIDVRLTSNFFLGAVNWILRWHSENDDMSPDEVSEQVLDLFLNGIAPRPDRPVSW